MVIIYLLNNLINKCHGESDLSGFNIIGLIVLLNKGE